MHEYLKRLFKVAEQGVFKPGVYMIFIAHDKDCPFFKGQTCQCNPEITIIPYDEAPLPGEKKKHAN